MKTAATKETPSPSATRVKKAGFTSANATVRQQLASIHNIIQSKIKVGQPNDRFEREADQVADRVMSSQPVQFISPLTHSLSRSSYNETKSEDEEKPVNLKPDEQEQAEEEPIQTKRLQRLATQDDEKSVQLKWIQRQVEAEQEEPEQEEEPQNVQSKATDEIEEEPLQAILLQREEKEPEEPQEQEEPVQAKGNVTSIQKAADVVENPGSGAPMLEDTRAHLESSMGADLSAVRVHEDSSAHQAAEAINARAFTHKNDIWLGAGQSQSDLRLMAHESTHVVQQRGGMSQNNREISASGAKVQRWNPFSAAADAVSSAVEWVGDTIEGAIDYIKEAAADFVSDMPGYSLFTVMYGEDPISGRTVERNGRNFINAGLDVIPNGQLLKNKLEQEGALDEAAQWLDEQIELLDFSPADIGNQLLEFWNSISIADATRPGSVLKRFGNIIGAPISRLVRFAVNVGKQLLEIIKRYVQNSLIGFIKERTNGYPLLTVILARDPIKDEVVERTPMALFRGFMQLSDSGAEQLRQMEESGSLQRAVDWLDGAVKRLNITWPVIRQLFTEAWDLVTIENLLSPVTLFRNLYNLFADPIGRIVNFVVEVGAKVLGFIKDALVNRLVAYARTVRGYPLIGVILGRDPFSQKLVERTVPNIIRGFMSLMENGEQQYREMEQSGAIARMADRVEAAMAALNFTWEYIRGLFTSAWESFSLQDLAKPFAAFARILNIFASPIRRLFAFVVEIVKIVLEVVMVVMNFPIDLIRNIVARSLQAMDDIKRAPVAFLKNMLLAVKTGFQQFFSNILTHLFSGVTGWLFSELRDAGINPPGDLSFRSILGFVLDVLGITVERIWQKVAERIGPEKVARIRSMADRLTGAWAFIKDVTTRGPIAIWEYVQERLSSLWNTVLESVKSWVVTRVIERVTAKLLSMLDPTGIMAVVNGFIAFYNAVQSFIRYLRELLEIVNSFVVGIAEMARGNVTLAANFLEGALARGIPVAIGFLANQVGLSGLGRRIGEMIQNVRGMVDQALTWLVDKAVTAGSSLLNGARNVLGRNERPMSHRQIVAAVQQQLSTPARSEKPADAIREKREQATRLEQQYQSHLEPGIRLTITTNETVASAETDNDIDFNIRIAPNDATGTAQSPLAGQWPTGTQTDPIPIRWYKSAGDYPTIQGKGPTQGVTLPATPGRAAQDLKVSTANFPPQGSTLSRTSGRSDTVKSQVYSRLRDLRTNSGWVITDSPYAIDHVLDLQWNGSDAYDNLWPLLTRKNSGANSSKYQRVKAMEGGNAVMKSVGAWGTSKYFWIAEIVSPRHGHSKTEPVNDGNAIPKRKP